MKYCIVVNKGKPNAMQVAAEYAKEIASMQASYYYYDGAVESGTDFALVFGGDGTILKFVRSSDASLPILGINCGNMGFLTEMALPAKELLSKLASGEYTQDKRKLLCINCCGKQYHALNDVVIGRDDFINLMDISVSTTDVVLDKYRADGVIIATPTGSTAYSLSAGGPVLSPSVPAVVVTPISPHSLHSKPIVLADSETINVTVQSPAKCIVVVDGVNVCTAQNELSISVCTDDKTATFVRLHNHSFYKTMVSKLNKGEN